MQAETPAQIAQARELFLEYVRRGDMRVHDLITHRFRPEQAAQAYETLRENRESAVGVLFEWTAV